MKIITNGDSWAFGGEIVDPVIKSRYDPDLYPGFYDFIDDNDQYRIERIWPTYLGELMKSDVINLSWPADDNGTILNRTMTYITSNFFDGKKVTEDLFVVIGWSSPERNFFWYKDDEVSMRFRLWPQVQHFDAKPQEEFWKIYVEYLWNKEEYLPRFVMNIILFQNFCDAHGIKWLCFNSFYQTPQKYHLEWEDMNYQKEVSELYLGHHSYSESNGLNRSFQNYEYSSLWSTINDLRFYKKNDPNNTFQSFIKQSGVTPVYYGQHPSPESHKVWANELFRYINDNNLI